MLQIAIHFHPIHAAVKYIDVLSNVLCNCNKYIINKNNVITKYLFYEAIHFKQKQSY